MSLKGEQVTTRCRSFSTGTLLLLALALTAFTAAPTTPANAATFVASGGATVADVALLRRVVGPDMGVKAAGGVRDLKSAKAMIDAGADRIGASVGVKIGRQSCPSTACRA